MAKWGCRLRPGATQLAGARLIFGPNHVAVPTNRGYRKCGTSGKAMEQDTRFCRLMSVATSRTSMSIQRETAKSSGSTDIC